MHASVRLFAAGLCAAGLASAALAQGQLTPRSNTAPPSSAARAALAAPQPPGLRSVFPAGISSGSGAAVSSDPIARSNSPIPPGDFAGRTPGTTGRGSPGVTAPGTTPVVIPPVEFPSTGFTGAVTTFPSTNVMGAGATTPGPAQGTTAGAGGFAAVDIARSFFFADANHDGDLTRAEARRLSISTMSFEETDRNFDGLISRFEYEDSVR